jgi:hypothetical protein
VCFLITTSVLYDNLVTFLMLLLKVVIAMVRLPLPQFGLEYVNCGYFISLFIRTSLYDFSRRYVKVFVRCVYTWCVTWRAVGR